MELPPHQLTMTVLMTPDMANFAGNVHGGTVLKFLDQVAYACASRYAGCYVVTLSVDQVMFLQPIHVGELVTFLAAVNHTGSSSMEVGIKVVAENIRSQQKRHVNSCFFTMVAVDDDGRVIGCVALHVFWRDLAELKCLAVSEDAHGLGIGRRLLDACWNAARELDIDTVFALTYAAEFFEKCGYHPIDKAELPHKIWNECVRCPLFPNCHEVALVRSVGSPGVGSVGSLAAALV